MESLVSKRIESKNKLKKAFEDIYSRYSREFPEADEIDLLSESVVVDNGFVRNTPVKEIGKCVKSFHSERYNPYPVESRKRSTKLLYDDDAFDSILGKSKKKFKSIKITPNILQGFYSTPVKEKFIHLGDLELKSPLDPLTTPVKILVKSITPIKVSGKNNLGKIKTFKARESPLKHELFTEVTDSDIEDSQKKNKQLKDSIRKKSKKVKTKSISKGIQIPKTPKTPIIPKMVDCIQDCTKEANQENITLENVALGDLGDVALGDLGDVALGDLQNVVLGDLENKGDGILEVKDSQTSSLKSIDPIKEETGSTKEKCSKKTKESVAKEAINLTIDQVKEETGSKDETIIKENIVKEAINSSTLEIYCKNQTLEFAENASQELNSNVQNAAECGSWWDIYGEESNSPEYKSRTVVYDSEVDELNTEMSEPKRRKHSSGQSRGTMAQHQTPVANSKTVKNIIGTKSGKREATNELTSQEPKLNETENLVFVQKDLSKALKEEEKGDSTFRIVVNDKSDEMMILLTGLKNLFQKQLPKMPKEYIARLVYDRNHVSVAVVRAPFSVVGGITYRPFVQRNFAEIVFCAIASTEQVQGYGSRLMCHVKEYVKKTHGVQNFLTYADNYAIGYFKKQGFTTDITLDKALWVGYIKDYEGGTLMQCTMVPKFNYLDVRAIIAAQKMAFFEKIREYTKSHIVYGGINFRNKPIDPATIPGINEAGWNPKIKEISASPQKARGPFYHLMRKLLTEMQEHPSSWPFLQPVSGVPDYYNVIKEPMDMRTLDENLEDSKYTTLEAFHKDVCLIFSNCKSYNEDGATYVKCANRVEKWFKDKFRQLKAEQRIP